MTVTSCLPYLAQRGDPVPLALSLRADDVLTRTCSGRRRLLRVNQSERLPPRGQLTQQVAELDRLLLQLGSSTGGSHGDERLRASLTEAGEDRVGKLEVEVEVEVQSAGCTCRGRRR